MLEEPDQAERDHEKDAPAEPAPLEEDPGWDEDAGTSEDDVERDTWSPKRERDLKEYLS